MRFEAPIPGANLVADTRNYPWHRPPDLTDYDEAVAYMIDRITQEEQAELLYSLLEIKTPVTAIVSGLLMQAIAKGKFQIDLAILIAGPVARYIQIWADDEEYNYEMGITNPDRIRMTPTLLKVALGIIDEDADQQEPAPMAMPAGGLMGAPEDPVEGQASEDEQASMLGMMADEPVEEEQPDGPLA
mgnify:FL=1